MYGFVLALHSLLRWAVLGFAAVAVAGAWSGRFAGRAFGAGARRRGALFVAALDAQFIAGILLYAWLSPHLRPALAAPAQAMRDPALRYWLVEHPSLAILGIALAHAGQALSKRAPSDEQRWRRASVLFTAALLSLLAAVPWPGLSQGRPLWPF
jgi:hypothetical protein